MSGIKKYFSSPEPQDNGIEPKVVEVNKKLMYDLPFKEKSNKKSPKHHKNKSVKNVQPKSETSNMEFDCFNNSQDSNLNDGNVAGGRQLAGSHSMPKYRKSKVSGDNIDKKNSERSQNVKSEKEIDAFQFMMHARNKSIGTNSPGKEKEESEILKDMNKELLSKRRIKFEAWAAEKGGLKRKMTEEIIDTHLKHEMDKRAKRLKKLLSNKSKGKVTENDVIEVEDEISNKHYVTDESSIRDKNINLKQKIKLRKKSREVSKCIVENNSAATEKKSRNSESKHGKSINIKISENQLNTPNSKVHDDVNDGTCSFKCNKDDDFVLKLNSPIKKNRNLLSYFGKVNSRSNVETCIEHDLQLPSEIINTKTSDELNIGSPKVKVENFDLNVQKTSKSRNKLKLVTPTSKWKIRIRNNDYDDNMQIDQNPPESCIDLCDSFSDTDNSITNKLNNKQIAKNSTNSTPKRLAPLFKKTPRLVHDKKQVKAKEDFLKSGVPEKCRLMIQKQQSFNNLESPVFPTVSHVQQHSTDAYIWNLPIANLEFLQLRELNKEDDICCHPKNSSLLIGTLTSCKRPQLAVESALSTNSMDLNLAPANTIKCKDKLTELKTKNPEFPVYKTFHILKQKNETLIQINDKHIICDSRKQDRKENVPKGAMNKGKKSKRKSLNKEFTKSNVLEDNIEIREKSSTVTSKMSAVHNLLWTDTFSPIDSTEFIGNTAATRTLKNWLTQWKEYSVLKYKNCNYDSDCSYNSDFDFADSNDSFSTMPNFKSLKNTALLLGPVGSGKTSVIYSLARELGFNVIELNASSKRTGKIAFTVLREATQSHRVRSKNSVLCNPANICKPRDIKVKKFKSDNEGQLLLKAKKMCNISDEALLKATKVLSLILVEDIDIVFDQDEGFISALLQIIQTSKRPIIFTSCCENNINVQKFMNNLVIRLKPVNSKIMTTWLQILCLVNKINVNSTSIFQLYESCNGDLRKILLQLQFWVLSGGELNEKKFVEKNPILVDKESTMCNKPTRLKRTNSVDNIEFSPDESSNLSCIDTKENHTCILCTCKKMNSSACCNLFTLEYLWFHLSYNNFSESNSFENSFKTLQHTTNNLSQIVQFLDTTSLIDNILAKVEMVKFKETQIHHDIENISDYLIRNSYSTCRIDPHESYRCQDDVRRSHHDIYHCVDTLSAGTNVKMQKANSGDSDLFPNKKFNKAFVLDYNPIIRTICRAEKQRSETNIKRITSNRFYHYLKTLDINYNEDILNFACNSLL